MTDSNNGNRAFSGLSKEGQLPGSALTAYNKYWGMMARVTNIKVLIMTFVFIHGAILYSIVKRTFPELSQEGMPDLPDKDCPGFMAR